MMKYIILILLFFYLPAFAQDDVKVDYFLDGAMITGIEADQNGLWIATYGRGIYYFSKKDGKWTNYSTSNNALQQDFFYCITANGDYVWAGSSDGLFTYEIKRNFWRKRKFGLGGEMGNWIRSIKYDKHQDVLWIGRFKYLTRLEVQKNKFSDYDMTVSNDVKTNTIKMIKLDGDSLVWFGTEAGIHKYDKSKSIDDKSSLLFMSNKTDDFMGDGDAVSVSDMLFEGKYVWFGLDEFVTAQKPNFNIGGLYKYNRRSRWDRFDTFSGLPGNGIFCLEKTGNYIWASVYEFDKDKKEQFGKGIALINRVTKKITAVSKDDLKLKSDKILCMYYDKESLWLGTDAGLLKIQLSNKFSQWKK